MKTERLELLKKLTLASGISGDEKRIRKIMQEEIKSTYKIDRMGSIVFDFPGAKEKPKILFLAHMDEIGFIISDILESGFIKIQPIGGWNPNTLPSSPILAKNRFGEKFPGIIANIPIHFLKNKEQKKIEIQDLFVDVGASSKKDIIENYKLQLGDNIVPIPNYHFSEQNRLMFSKAFDDRAGIGAVIEIAKNLKDQDHPNTIICAGSVQEEVGTRGAVSLANHVDADICFILEGAPSDDVPGIAQKPQTAVGKGAHIRLFDPTMIVKQELAKFVIELAKTNNIKHQLTVRKGGGTDGRAIHTANHGIPTMVLGVPVRYAHSHNCISSLDDYDALISLCVKIVENLDKKNLDRILS